MNTINKQFNTILVSPNKNLKRQICLDICQSITEYGDYVVFILQNIYKMLGSDNRNLAWMILRALRSNNLIVVKTEYEVKVKKERVPRVCVVRRKKLLHGLLPITRVVLIVPEQILTQIDTLLFLGATAKDYANAVVDLETQKKEVSKIAGIDERFVKIELIEASDVVTKHKNISGSCKPKDFTIENVVDFFDAIMRDLTDSEWGKRHGAFGALMELFNAEQKTEDLDYVPVSIETINKSEESSIGRKSLDEMDVAPDIISKQITHPSEEIPPLSSLERELDNEFHSEFSGIVTSELEDKTEQSSDTEDNKKNERHSEASSVIKYKLPTTVMNTILQVIYSDKFCDFTTDQISMPVREMAGALMKAIFTHEYFLIQKLFDFLSHEDWQVKCGSLITLHKILNHLDDLRKTQFCEILTNLLETKDEDIIFFCAEILCDLGPFLDINRIKTICWESFIEGSELAIGKKSIFKLLTVVYHKTALETNLENKGVEQTLIELPKNIYNYFRSPITDVRLSIIEMVSEIYPFIGLSSKNNISKCLIENVLLEDDSKLCGRNIEMLKNLIYDIPSDILKHYLDVVSGNLHKGYSIKDFFVTSENLLFSDSGVKLIGKEDVLRTRLEYIRILLVYLFSRSNTTSDNKLSNTTSNTVTLNGGSILFRNAPNNLLLFTQRDISCQTSILALIFYNFINLYYKYPRIEIDPLSLFSNVPQGEFRKCLLDKHYMSHMPSINDNAVFYYRLQMALNLTEENIICLLERETSKDFVIFVSLVLRLNNLITLKLIQYVYFLITSDTCPDSTPLIYFFKDYNFTENVDFMIFLKEESNALQFLSKVSFILPKDCKGNLNPYFPIALHNRIIPIIRFFISDDFYYTELLIGHLLGDMNPQIISNTIDLINFSYYFLLVKPLLRNISDPLLCKVFSHITPYLSIHKIHKEVNIFRYRISDAIREINGLFSSYDYEINVPTDVKLRDYQKRAVCWMAFLKEYGINGVLADDMGLGKTVMVLAFLSNEIFKMKERRVHKGINGESINGESINDESINGESSNDDINNKDMNGIKNMDYNGISNYIKDLNKDVGSKPDQVRRIKQILILTPGSLTGHWENEIKTKFNYLSCKVYKKKAIDSDVIITSFDQFRHDHSYFINIEYFYLIIDEGHVLRNRETMLYKRIKGIKAQHKLVLTGTPVQNSVDDVFSLFNFLIPNFLGTEAEFAKNFTSIISHAREQRATERDQQKCEEALLRLRKTVGPFILRRLKCDVLKDLPPKVVTDIIVELDDLERNAYDDFGQADEGGYGKKGFGKIIEIIKVCSHKLYIKKDSRTIKNEEILSEGTERINEIKRMSNYLNVNQEETVSGTRALNATVHKKNIRKSKNLLLNLDQLQSVKKVKKNVDSTIDLSAKIKALFDIITLCGDMNMTHKIIVFAQFRSTIDFIISDLNTHKPFIKISRIDGSTKPELRAKIAQDFNSSDTNILLATTATGGLGLNLTGADTVVMYEHDWNPFNDLQAMDRAHRIGQKKTVNVYRLITKDTYEQAIMNLQNFKLFVSSKIVDSKNEEWDVEDVIGKIGGVDV